VQFQSELPDAGRDRGARDLAKRGAVTVGGIGVGELRGVQGVDRRVQASARTQGLQSPLGFTGCEKLNSAPISRGFVTGHDFSRAAKS